MLATLLEAREDTLSDISGACNNSSAFRKLLNTATRRLMRRGDWAGLIQSIRVCVSSGCVVFPREVGQVRAINVCCNPTPINSLWYQYMPRCDYRRWCGNGCSMTQAGRSPVFQDVQGDNRLIRAYARYPADIGKTIKIFGTDDNGQVLMTNNGDGSYSEGITLTLSSPYGSTNVFVRHIDRILKDATEGPVDCYAYNSSTGLLEDLAHYQPTETNPAYAKYSLNVGCGGTSSTKSVMALIKLQFIPAETDTDLVLIENLDALKDFMMSLKFREDGDARRADEYEKSSIRELNLELKDVFPDEQMAIDTGTLGGTCIGRQKVW